MQRLTRAFDHYYGPHQFITSHRWQQGRYVGDYEMSDDRAPLAVVLVLPPPTFLLIVLVHMGDRLCRPPSLLREGPEALMWMASLTPLSNHLDSTSNILALSRLMLCPGQSL